MRARHIALLLILTLLLSSFASANPFTDFWAKLTGNAVSDKSKQDDNPGNNEKPDNKGGKSGESVSANGQEGKKGQPKLTPKGLLRVIENQLKQLSTAFLGDRKSQAALKRLGEDLNKLKTLTGQEPGEEQADGADDGSQGLYDALGCSACGNGVREGKEQCDGADLGGQTCESYNRQPIEQPGPGGNTTSGSRTAAGQEGPGGVVTEGNRQPIEQPGPGSLRCKADCTFDASACSPFCGNGVREGSEQCDGTDMGTPNCEGTEDPSGTSYLCTSQCMWNPNPCSLLVA